MGKTTGFMDYKRKTSADVPPLERIENFNEFHIWLSREEGTSRISSAICLRRRRRGFIFRYLHLC